jgi:hypothetical protein
LICFRNNNFSKIELIFYWEVYTHECGECVIPRRNKVQSTGVPKMDGKILICEGNTYALKQGNHIGVVHFIKYDIQGVYLKCAEILLTSLWNTVEN